MTDKLRVAPAGMSSTMANKPLGRMGVSSSQTYSPIGGVHSSAGLRIVTPLNRVKTRNLQLMPQSKSQQKNYTILSKPANKYKASARAKYSFASEFEKATKSNGPADSNNHISRNLPVGMRREASEPTLKQRAGSRSALSSAGLSSLGINNNVKLPNRNNLPPSVTTPSSHTKGKQFTYESVIGEVQPRETSPVRSKETQKQLKDFKSLIQEAPQAKEISSGTKGSMESQEVVSIDKQQASNRQMGSAPIRTITVQRQNSRAAKKLEQVISQQARFQQNSKSPTNFSSNNLQLTYKTQKSTDSKKKQDSQAPFTSELDQNSNYLDFQKSDTRKFNSPVFQLTQNSEHGKDNFAQGQIAELENSTYRPSNPIVESPQSRQEEEKQNSELERPERSTGVFQHEFALPETIQTRSGSRKHSSSETEASIRVENQARAGTVLTESKATSRLGYQSSGDKGNQCQISVNDQAQLGTPIVEEAALSLRMSNKGPPNATLLPLGCLKSVLFLASLLQGGTSINNQICHIRIPDTLLVTPNSQEPILLSNSFDQESGRLVGQPFQLKDIENLFCSWLQQNLRKSNQGTFVPLTMCKSVQLQPYKHHLDFFIASSVKTFNERLRENKKYMFDNSGAPKKDSSFIMQRYMPPLDQEKSALVLRCSWKRNVGFKVYKLHSLVPTDGVRFTNFSPKQFGAKGSILDSPGFEAGSPVKTLQSSGMGSPVHLREQSSARDKQFVEPIMPRLDLTELKLLSFQALTGAYKKIQNYSPDMLTECLLKHDSNSQDHYGVKINMNSIKNKQHLCLQNEIDQNFNVSEQFCVMPENDNLIRKEKIRANQLANGQESYLNYEKMIISIQKQMLELVKLTDLNLLHCQGVELKKLECDFIPDYQGTDQLVNEVCFHQIVSYNTNPIQFESVAEYTNRMQPQSDMESVHAFDPAAVQNMPVSPLQPDQKYQVLGPPDSQRQNQQILPHQFKCFGDYCYVTKQSMIPKHLAPVINQLIHYQLPKVSQRTIQIERDNKADAYQLLDQPYEVFQTYLKQEGMLRPDLKDKEAEVCTTCFHIYRFLEENYYGDGSADLEKALPIIHHEHRKSEEFSKQDSETGSIRLTMGNSSDHFSRDTRSQQQPQRYCVEEVEMMNSEGSQKQPASQQNFVQTEPSGFSSEDPNNRASPETTQQLGSTTEGASEGFNNRETGFKIPSSQNLSYLNPTMSAAQMLPPSFQQTQQSAQEPQPTKPVLLQQSTQGSMQYNASFGSGVVQTQLPLRQQNTTAVPQSPMLLGADNSMSEPITSVKISNSENKESQKNIQNSLDKKDGSQNHSSVSPSIIEQEEPDNSSPKSPAKPESKQHTAEFKAPLKQNSDLGVEQQQSSPPQPQELKMKKRESSSQTLVANLPHPKLDKTNSSSLKLPKNRKLRYQTTDSSIVSFDSTVQNSELTPQKQVSEVKPRPSLKLPSPKNTRQRTFNIKRLTTPGLTVAVPKISSGRSSKQSSGRKTVVSRKNSGVSLKRQQSPPGGGISKAFFAKPSSQFDEQTLLSQPMNLTVCSDDTKQAELKQKVSNKKLPELKESARSKSKTVKLVMRQTDINMSDTSIIRSSGQKSASQRYLLNLGKCSPEKKERLQSSKPPLGLNTLHEQPRAAALDSIGNETIDALSMTLSLNSKENPSMSMDKCTHEQKHFSFPPPDPPVFDLQKLQERLKETGQTEIEPMPEDVQKLQRKDSFFDSEHDKLFQDLEEDMEYEQDSFSTSRKSAPNE